MPHRRCPAYRVEVLLAPSYSPTDLGDALRPVADLVGARVAIGWQNRQPGDRLGETLAHVEILDDRPGLDPDMIAAGVPSWPWPDWAFPASRWAL